MKYLIVGTVICVFAAGSVLAPTILAQEPGAQPKVSPKVLAFVKPVAIAAGDTELQKKLKERHNSAARLLDLRIKEYQNGVRDVGPVFEAARLVAEAKLDLAATPEARISILEQTLEVARLAEGYLQSILAKGFGSPADLERARFARLSVEVELLKARQKDRPAPK
jgi:outer membrane protein TolC